MNQQARHRRAAAIAFLLLAACLHPLSEIAHAAQAQNGRAPKKVALLVGINRYRSASIRQLTGCRNDVEAMRRLLIGRFGFRAEDIQSLEDQRATYAGIVHELNRLIRMTGEVKGDPRNGDIVVIHFSGHGSQEYSANSASGHTETLVPYDSRDPKNLDITADAFSSMLAELGKRTKNITVILDSCYSGRIAGKTRGLDEIAGLRGISPAKDSSPGPPYPSVGARSVRPGQSPWSPLDDSYVLIASALATQTAKEYRAGGRSFGALTYFLSRELATATPTATYRNVMDLVRLEVERAVPDQTPHVVGPNADRFFLGNTASVVQPYTLLSREGPVVRLPYSGAVHGVAIGARYDAYSVPPLVPADKPNARIEVTDVSDFESRAEVVDGVVPEIAYGVLRERGVKRNPMWIWVAQLPQLAEVRRSLQQSKGFVLASDPSTADVWVNADENGIGLSTPDGLPLSDPQKKDSKPDDVLQALSRWSNWFGILGLANPESGLGIRLDLIKRDRGPTASRLPRIGKASTVLPEGAVLAPIVWNDSNESVYVSLIALSSDRSITVLFPAKGDANARFELKPRSSRELPVLQTQLPSCLSTTLDTVMLFASTQPISFFGYEQKGFCEPERNLASVHNIGVQGWRSHPGKWNTTSRVIEVRKTKVQK